MLGLNASHCLDNILGAQGLRYQKLALTREEILRKGFWNWKGLLEGDTAGERVGSEKRTQQTLKQVKKKKKKFLDA